MSAADFRAGDRVDSPIGFSGRVTKVERGTVYAVYEDKSGRSEAVYTPAWFTKYPGMLKKTWVRK